MAMIPSQNNISKNTVQNVNSLEINYVEPGDVVHDYNPKTKETKREGSKSKGQPQLYSKTSSPSSSINVVVALKSTRLLL